MLFNKILDKSLRWAVVTNLMVVWMAGSAARAQELPKKEDKPTDWERLIYLPYKNFSAVLNQEQSTVFLPYGQYLKLWRAARPETTDPKITPIQSVITQATYTGKIENNLARIEATFKVKVLDKPWARVPLKFGEAAVGRLTTENDQILLIGTGEGTYDLLLPTVGEHTVKLELITRVHSSTEGKSFDLEIPLVGISNLELTVPSPDQTVDVIPHLVSSPLEADANSTKIAANVGSTNKITARWFPRVSKTPEMELLTSVTNQIHARVADGLVQTEAILTYQVLRGELNQVVVSIPLGHRILDVTAPNLKGWKAANEANRQVITIDLLGGNAKTIPVEIRTERSATGDILELGGIEEDGKVDGIHAVGAVRESGIIVAGHGPELAIAVEQQRGLIRIEANEVPEGLRRPENLYFKFYNPKFRLGVSAKPVEPRVNVNHVAVLEFFDDELKLTSQLDYTVERAGLFELKYAIPDGVKIDSVDCEQKQEFTLTPDGKLLTLTLNQKTQGAIKVVVRGHLSFMSSQQQQLKLPILEPQGVFREQGTLRVYAPEAIEVITDEKGVIAAQPDRAIQGQGQGGGVLRLASGWTFNRRPVEIPVTTVRKPTRLTASMATTLNVNREIVEVVSQVIFSVQYAGIDTFRIAVPATVSDTVQIEALTAAGAVPIKQKSQAPAKDGWVTWTIITQREAVGDQSFRVKYDLKLSKQDQTAKITVQPVRPLGVPGTGEEPERVPVTNLLGEIVVQKDRIWSLAATPKELQTIDVRELTLLPPQGALAYRYSRPAVELELTATEHEIQEVVQTVISRALVEIVQTQEETVTYRCRFLLKTSERQRLQLELPAKVQPLGVMVAGKQVSLERSPQASSGKGEMYYVNVARAGRSDEQFGLTIVFRIPAKELPETLFSGPLEMAIPQLGATTNQQAVAVQQLRVAVWVPEQYTLVGTPQHFTPEYRLDFFHALDGYTTSTKSTADLDSWIGEAGTGLFEFPTAGHAFVYNNLGGTDTLKLTWWRTSWTAWAWGLALLIVAFVLRRTSWENKLGMLLVGVFAASLFALSDPDLAMFIVRSSRYGVGLLVAVWVIHLFLQKKPEAEAANKSDLSLAYAVSPPPGVFEDMNKSMKP